MPGRERSQAWKTASTEGFFALRSERGASRAFLLQQRQQGAETALDNVFFLERGEAGAAGLDEKGFFAQARGGIAFAEDGEAAVFAAQFAGKGEEFLKGWILHRGQLISWPPVTLKAMPVM